MSKTHAAFGASGAHRWLVCAASATLQDGMPDTTNEHAAEGTCAHELGEMALRSGKNCDTYLGMTLHADGFEFEVDEDMAAHVQTYVDYVREKAAGDAVLMIEHRFDLAKIRPPVPMFGTADAVIYQPGERRLYVVDLKYGRGKLVDADDNPQLKYYGLGALLAMDPGLPVDDVVLVVAQPRAGGIKESAPLPVEALLDYAIDIIDAARRALAPDPVATPGDHCRWCKAEGVCPARREAALTVAQEEFAAVAKPELMTVEEMAAVLDKADAIEDWLRAFRAHVHRVAESGAEIPGYKLVPKRAMRRWAYDEAEVKRRLAEVLPPEDIVEEPKLKSPAAIEKLTGKKSFPSDLVVAVSSGYNLVRGSDPRPAVSMLAAGHEFEAEPAPGTTK